MSGAGDDGPSWRSSTNSPLSTSWPEDTDDADIAEETELTLLSPRVRKGGRITALAVAEGAPEGCKAGDYCIFNTALDGNDAGTRRVHVVRVPEREEYACEPQENNIKGKSAQGLSTSQVPTDSWSFLVPEQINEPEAFCRSLAAIPNSTLVMVGESRGRVSLFDWTKATQGNLECAQPVCVLETHGRSKVRSVAVAAWEHHVGASGGFDGIVKLWDLEAATCVANLRCGDDSQADRAHINQVAITPDARIVVQCDGAGEVAFWDVRAESCILQIKESRVITWAIDVREDGAQIATAGTDELVSIWPDHKVKASVDMKVGGFVDCVKFFGNRGGSMVAAGSRDNRASVFDVSEQRHLQTFVGHEADVNCIDALHDGSRIVTAGDDGTVRIGDIIGASMTKAASKR